MATNRKGVILDLAHAHWESFHQSRTKALLLEKWLKGEQYEADPEDPDSRYHGRPYYPRRDNGSTTAEYDNLAQITPNSWADLVVRSVSQTARIHGIRRPGSQENLNSWETFRRNRWPMHASAIHRTAIGLGTAYGVVVPGNDPFNGDRMARMLGRSPTRMAAWYDGDDDEWARFAMEAEPYSVSDGPYGAITETGWNVRFYDEDAIHRITVRGDGWDRQDWYYIDHETHPLRVPPVARCTNRMDLDGTAVGEIEPILPLLRRIDQDTFDRLIVQRFGAWKVRYISGMAKPSSQEAANIQALKLRVEDLLISGNPDTRFGTLDASDPKVFSDVTDADLRMLAAITQTPPHHLLGLSSNLQAEALAAATEGLDRKSKDFKGYASEFHEQMARMAAAMRGDMAEARAWDLQINWADTTSQSLTQAADALGKLADQLHVPVEMLWERIPNWTDSDTERARELIENGDTIDRLLAELVDPGEEEPPGAGEGPDDGQE